MSSAYDVNDAGVVAGYVGSWPDVRAAICSEGVLSYLALPEDATGSIAVAINNRGQVAGQLSLASGAWEAAIWNSSSGGVTRLGIPTGGFFSSAQDINDTGSIVGVAGMSGGTRAVLWDENGTHLLPLPSGYTSSTAQGINNSGAIAGTADTGYPLPPPYPPSVAVVWRDGVAHVLRPLVDGAAASASDINDAGQVIGNSATTAAPWLVRDAVLWNDDGPIDLGSLGGNFGLASAINADGVVAGYMTDPATNENHAFAWSSGALTLLDPLADDHLSVALGINAEGQIVGISAVTNGPLGRAVTWTLPSDTTPPELSVSVSPSVLWPPNHKYVTVQANVTATDDSGVDPTVELISVTSNEPDNALGDDDGNTTNDILNVDKYTFQLRAERNKNGAGRVYTITYSASDASGNVTTRSATVTVP
jgi:probable HAF family extracellular repeat protein